MTGLAPMCLKRQYQVQGFKAGGFGIISNYLTTFRYPELKLQTGILYKNTKYRVGMLKTAQIIIKLQCLVRKVMVI